MIPNRRRQQGLQYGIFLLYMQAMNIGIDKIPPATLIGVAAQVICIPMTRFNYIRCFSATTQLRQWMFSNNDTVRHVNTTVFLKGSISELKMEFFY